MRASAPRRALSRLPLASSLAVLGLAALLSAAPAGAILRAGEGEMGFDLGATQFDDNVEDDTGFRAGWRFGQCLSDAFELEGQVLATGLSIDGDDVILTAGFLNAVVNFHPAETIVPYLLLGGGYASTEVDFGDVSVSDESFAAQGAIGSRFFFGPSGLGLRVEAAALSERTFDESSLHWSLTAGLTWRFR